MSLMLFNLESMLSTPLGFTLIGIFGMLVSVGGSYKITKSGVYYLWGEPVRKKENPGQFLFIYFVMGFLFCASVFMLFLGLSAHAA